ncbi:hypothetical protein ACWOBE_07545 [Hutsoniella sourekii]
MKKLIVLFLILFLFPVAVCAKGDFPVDHDEIELIFLEDEESDYMSSPLGRLALIFGLELHDYLEFVPVEKENLMVVFPKDFEWQLALASVANEEYNSDAGEVIRVISTIYDYLPEDVDLDFKTVISSFKKDFFTDENKIKKRDVMFVISKNQVEYSQFADGPELEELSKLIQNKFTEH